MKCVLDRYACNLTPSSRQLAIIVAALIVASLAGCLKKPSQQEIDSEVFGVVVSNGKPVPNATVRWKGTPHSTTTNADGQYRLPLSQIPDDSESRVVTASAEGFFISGCRNWETSPSKIELVPIPSKDNEAYEWVDPTPDDGSPGNCANCHAEIFDQWSSGSHSDSVTDFHFLDLYAGTTQHQQPPSNATWSLLRDRPDGAGVCTSCHAPSAPLDQLAVGDIRDVQGVAKYGVHCDFCHKVAAVTTENVGITHGRFAMDLLRPEHDQLFFGPLDDIDRGEDVYAAHFSKSEFCAACHEGTIFGVHVYGTYSEWQESPAKKNGKQCQDCHMKPDGAMTNVAPNSGGIERDPSTLASHQLFPNGKAAMLKNCLEVDVSFHRKPKGDEAVVTITASNVGHRVPTGFVDRHVILLVDALDAQNSPVAIASGPRLPDSCGSLAGQPGRLFAKQLFDDTGNAPIPFWQEVFNITDTRLVPEVPNTTSFDLPPDAESLRVRVIYRRFWEMVEKEKGWPDGAIIVYDQLHRVFGNL